MSERERDGPDYAGLAKVIIAMTDEERTVLAQHVDPDRLARLTPKWRSEERRKAATAERPSVDQVFTRPDGARVPLVLTPITFREACAFVRRHHRHHDPPVGHFFSVAVAKDDRIVGVAIAGRPVARMLPPYVAEVARLCTDGTKNACSILYATSWRAARALGYKKLITYTLPSEGGASLRAAGWRLIGEAGGGPWDRKSRARVDTHPTQRKLKWEAGDA